MLIPPYRFAIVEENVYRGAYPVERNLPFLKTYDRAPKALDRWERARLTFPSANLCVLGSFIDYSCGRLWRWCPRRRRRPGQRGAPTMVSALSTFTAKSTRRRTRSTIPSPRAFWRSAGTWLQRNSMTAS